MLKLRLPILALILGLGTVACSAEDNTTTGSGGKGGSSGAGGGTGATGGTSGGDAACPKFDYTNYNPTKTPTLKNDIQPIFTISCALSGSCHQNGSTHHPNLGPSITQLDGGKPTDAQLTAIMSELNKPSTQVAGKNIVTSMKPEDSYLLNKVEGSNNCSGFVCMGPDKCGAAMPTPDPKDGLDKDTIELIRAWIKKGMPM